MLHTNNHAVVNGLNGVVTKVFSIQSDETDEEHYVLFSKDRFGNPLYYQEFSNLMEAMRKLTAILMEDYDYDGVTIDATGGWREIHT